MKDGKPIIVLWCALAILLAVVVVVRVIHKRGEPPLSSIVITDTNGMVTALTVSNQPVATMIYGYDTNRQKMADTNVTTRHYDANGEEISDTNASLPSGK